MWASPTKRNSRSCSLAYQPSRKGMRLGVRKEKLRNSRLSNPQPIRSKEASLIFSMERRRAIPLALFAS